jgi:hypothetical protein
MVKGWRKEGIFECKFLPLVIPLFKKTKITFKNSKNNMRTNQYIANDISTNVRNRNFRFFALWATLKWKKNVDLSMHMSKFQIYQMLSLLCSPQYKEFYMLVGYIIDHV